mgnify:CR=1 FL=1
MQNAKLVFSEGDGLDGKGKYILVSRFFMNVKDS